MPGKGLQLIPNSRATGFLKKAGGCEKKGGIEGAFFTQKRKGGQGAVFGSSKECGCRNEQGLPRGTCDKNLIKKGREVKGDFFNLPSAGGKR